jgi:hypothetical protein
LRLTNKLAGEYKKLHSYTFKFEEDFERLCLDFNNEIKQLDAQVDIEFDECYSFVFRKIFQFGMEIGGLDYLNHYLLIYSYEFEKIKIVKDKLTKLVSNW